MQCNKTVIFPVHVAAVLRLTPSRTVTVGVSDKDWTPLRPITAEGDNRGFIYSVITDQMHSLGYLKTPITLFCVSFVPSWSHAKHLRSLQAWWMVWYQVSADHGLQRSQQTGRLAAVGAFCSQRSEQIARTVRMTFQNVPNVQLPLYHLYSSLRVRSSRLKPNVLMSFAVSAENFHAEKFPLILLRSIPLHIAAELLIRCDKSNIRVM